MPATHTREERRAQAIERMRRIMDGADGASRSLSGEERQEFERLDTEVGQIERELRTRARVDELEGRAAPGSFWPEDDAQRAAELARDHERLAMSDLLVGGGVLTRGAHPGSLAEFRRRTVPLLLQDEDAYRSAFYTLLTARHGSELGPDERRALSKATAAAGANLVPTTFERTLIELARDTGVMRQISTVLTTQIGDTLQVPQEASHGVASWIGENVAYPTSDESFGQISLSAYKAGTLMLMSEELLIDGAFDLEAYIGRQYAIRIGILENTAYVLGDGAGKPTGVVTSVATGRTGATGQTITVTGNDLIELIHSVLRPYRRNGKWLINDGSMRVVRLLKDANGQYLWQPGLSGGNPDTLLGYPVVTDPDMPVMAANAKSILFGDFSYYWIRDVQGIAIQRLDELFAANGQVGFKCYHRTDGKLMNTAAVKAYVNSAT